MGKDTPSLQTSLLGVLHEGKNVLTNHRNKSRLPKSDITKEEREALHNLRKDNNHMILTADKEVVLVVMDKDMYIEKFMSLLSDQSVYKECRDFIKSINTKVVRQVSDLKTI